VESVEGNVVTVRLPNGSTARVTVSDATSIRKTVPGTLEDLAAGQSVTIAGERGAEGAVAASAVQVLPEGQGSPARVAEGQQQPAAQNRGGQQGQRPQQTNASTPGGSAPQDNR
jgi:hypothetical protein